MKFSILFLTIFSFNIFLQAQSSISFTTNKVIYRTGDVIEVNFKTNTPLAQKSWIGLFKSSVPRTSDVGYLQYFYTNAKSKGSFEFKPPIETGNYELRLMSNDPHGKFLKAVAIKIRNIYDNELSFSLITEQVKPSQKFEVKIENTISVNPKAWIGIFEKGHPKNNAYGYKSYQYYSANKSNIIKLTAPNTTGDFELRLYSSDPGALIQSTPFRIGDLNLNGIRFSSDKSKYDPEKEIIVTYTGHSDLTDRAWIGLFKADAKPDSYEGYLTYFYLEPKEKGTLTFKAPATKGNYQIRMFYADYGPQLLEPTFFTVTSSINKEYIKEKLDSNGKISLYGIYFDTNKSTIKTASYRIIKEIADLLNENKDLKISIEGHTDNVGEKAYNQQLSEKRADAVLNLLTNNYNVSKSQLQSKGYGEIKPITDNNTSLGKSKNRRVELIKLK